MRFSNILREGLSLWQPFFREPTLGQHPRIGLVGRSLADNVIWLVLAAAWYDKDQSGHPSRESVVVHAEALRPD